MHLITHLLFSSSKGYLWLIYSAPQIFASSTNQILDWLQAYSSFTPLSSCSQFICLLRCLSLHNLHIHLHKITRLFIFILLCSSCPTSNNIIIHGHLFYVNSYLNFSETSYFPLIIPTLILNSNFTHLSLVSLPHHVSKLHFFLIILYPTYPHQFSFLLQWSSVQSPHSIRSRHVHVLINCSLNIVKLYRSTEIFIHVDETIPKTTINIDQRE